MWNSADSTNFSSLNSFKRELHHFWQDILQFMSFRFSYELSILALYFTIVFILARKRLRPFVIYNK